MLRGERSALWAHLDVDRVATLEEEVAGLLKELAAAKLENAAIWREMKRLQGG